MKAAAVNSLYINILWCIQTTQAGLYRAGRLYLTVLSVLYGPSVYYAVDTVCIAVACGPKL